MARVGRHEEGARSRERVLAVASRLIAEQGYAATSISQISTGADVRAASIYWAFGSKEGLLAAVMERSATAFLEQQLRRAHRDGEPMPGIWEILPDLAESFRDGPEFLRLLLVMSLERRNGDPAVLTAARRVRAQSAELLAVAFQPDVAAAVADPSRRAAVCDELARFTLMLLDGVFVATQVEPDTTDVRRSFETIAVALRAARDRLVDEAVRTAARGTR